MCFSLFLFRIFSSSLSISLSLSFSIHLSISFWNYIFRFLFLSFFLFLSSLLPFPFALAWMCVSHITCKMTGPAQSLYPGAKQQHYVLLMGGQWASPEHNREKSNKHSKSSTILIKKLRWNIKCSTAIMEKPHNEFARLRCHGETCKSLSVHQVC